MSTLRRSKAAKATPEAMLLRAAAQLAALAALARLAPAQDSAACQATCNAACSVANARQLAERVRDDAEAATSAAALQAVWQDVSLTETYKRDHGFYVYGYTFAGTCVAHGAKPTKVGASIDAVFEHVGADTVNGTELQAERIELANSDEGGGWHEYDWPVHLHQADPSTPNVIVLKTKRAYIAKITAFDGAEYYVGCGFTDAPCETHGAAGSGQGVSALVVATQGLLALLFFGLSATVEVAAFRLKFEEKRGLVCGACCQFGVVPLLGYLATQAFQLPPHYGVTLLVLCSSPGGSYSNWWCSLFNADLALSVAMTACSTLLSLAMLPLNTMVYIKLAYGRDVSLAWATLALSLLNTVTAISLGLLAGHQKPKHRATFNAIGQAAGVLLMIISAVFAQKKQPIWNRDAAFYGATCLPFFLSALIATVAASLLRLQRPEQVAVVIE